MRKTLKWILRLFAVLITVGVMYTMTNGQISVHVDNTQKLAKNIIKHIKKTTDSSEVKLTLQFIEETGLEETYLKKLPAKLAMNYSYIDIYRATQNFQKHGKLTEKDLGLTGSTSLEKILNQMIVLEVNKRVKRSDPNVYHAITAYQYAIYLVLGLYLLTAVLMLFGRKWASLPLVLSTGGLFACLYELSQKTNEWLSGTYLAPIKVSLSPELYFGLIVGLALAVIWPIGVELVQRRERKQTTQAKQK